ncbi:unnamed protein product [Onchocerca ochengi]|uniref:C2 tensin-type domain-containing protein n=2 Tax=Onchocerca TaxID=6281 RepID=A0A182DZA8_ONCOC|nr:unnamed protein product [Onchocerca ochengi]
MSCLVITLDGVRLPRHPETPWMGPSVFRYPDDVSQSKRQTQDGEAAANVDLPDFDGKLNVLKNYDVDAVKFSEYFYAFIFTIPTRMLQTDYSDETYIIVVQICLTKPLGDIFVFLAGRL